MIAQVVPITRLRRDTTWWSYTIPPRLTCTPGSLVVVPFRGREMLGIVWSLEESNDKAELQISEVLTEIPLLKLPHRQLVEFLSDYGLCSLSTALYVWLPTALRELPLSSLTRTLLREYTQRPQIETAAQHCILAPGYRPQLKIRLQKKFGAKFSELFSDSESVDIQKWFRVANGELSLGLGSERALFAPWNNLQHITVIDPEDISYYHEQIPYLSLLTVATQLQNFTRSQTTYRSSLPHTNSQLWPVHVENNGFKAQVEVHDIRRIPLLNPDLIDRIKEVLSSGKHILILYNAHDHVAAIKKDSHTEKIVIPGIETVAKRLAHLLDASELPKSIILGTRSVLQETHSNIGLTIMLSIDPLLSQSSCFANMLHGASDIGKLGQYEAPCFIQTKHPDHPMVIALKSGKFESYIDEQILSQQEQKLPPFGLVIICSLPTSAPAEEVTKTHEQLSELFPEPWQVSHPLIATWRKKEYTHLVIQAPEPTSRVPIRARTYLVKLPRPWKVQRNPWYLL